MNRHRAGFTIVELLIVIVVIGILASVTIVAYNGINGRAHDAAVRSDLRNLENAISASYSTTGEYPGSGYDVTSVITDIKNNEISDFKFNTNSYAAPDLYTAYPGTAIVGYGPAGGPVEKICIVIKSKSGKNFMYTNFAGVLETTTINPIGGAHDFRAACGDEGKVPNTSGTGLNYGRAQL